MTHAKSKAINLLTIILTFMVALFVVTTVMYFYPRTIVEAPQSTTDKLEYRIREDVLVSGYTKVNVNAMSTNDVYIECGASSYVVQTFTLKMYKTEGSYPAFKLGIIPNGVTASPPTCKMVTRSTYHVHTFLWFTRDYHHTFETNSFSIIK